MDVADGRVLERGRICHLPACPMASPARDDARQHAKQGIPRQQHPASEVNPARRRDPNTLREELEIEKVVISQHRLPMLVVVYLIVIFIRG